MHCEQKILNRRCREIVVAKQILKLENELAWPKPLFVSTLYPRALMSFSKSKTFGADIFEQDLD